MSTDSANQRGSSRDVFVSYASQDAAVANSVVEALERQGIRCWIAPRDVRPGTEYADAIVAAINESKGVVLILSGSAVASSHVGREIERAASKHKRIIAFQIDAVPLSRSLEYFLSNSQWIDVQAVGVQAALEKLAEAVSQAPAVPLPKPMATKGGSRGAMTRAVVAAAIFVALAVGVLAFRFLWWKHGDAQSPAVAAISDKSIAVLPFADMSEKKDQEYFADGMAEEVLDRLANVPGIKVIGRTSSFQFKGKNEDLRRIGASLGAAYVVEGSVRKSGERLRVTAQLIGAQQGAHLWSETYDEDVGDVLKMQGQIAAGIVRALQVTMGADSLQAPPMLSNVEAYELYLRGRHAYDRFDKIGLETAEGYFQQALELDPSSIRAAEWLANTDETLPEMSFVLPRDGFERARVSAERAVKLNPQSGIGHANLASIHAMYDWDWAAAVEEGKRALALEPRQPVVLASVAEIDEALGKWDDAARLYNASLALDPLFPGTHFMLGTLRMGTGRLTEAEGEFRKVLEISPTYAWAHLFVGLTLLAEGRFEAALAAIQQEMAGGGRDWGLAFAYHAIGRKAEADAALTRYTKEYPDDAYGIAQVHAYRDELDEAFASLNQAYQQKSISLYRIKSNPFLKNLEPDPRYKTFLKKMNLPE